MDLIPEKVLTAGQDGTKADIGIASSTTRLVRRLAGDARNQAQSAKKNRLQTTADELEANQKKTKDEADLAAEIQKNEDRSAQHNFTSSVKNLNAAMDRTSKNLHYTEFEEKFKTGIDEYKKQTLATMLESASTAQKEKINQDFKTMAEGWGAMLAAKELTQRETEWNENATTAVIAGFEDNDMDAVDSAVSDLSMSEHEKAKVKQTSLNKVSGDNKEFLIDMYKQAGTAEWIADVDALRDEKVLTKSDLLKANGARLTASGKVQRGLTERARQDSALSRTKWDLNMGQAATSDDLKDMGVAIEQDDTLTDIDRSQLTQKNIVEVRRLSKDEATDARNELIRWQEEGGNFSIPSSFANQTKAGMVAWTLVTNSPSGTLGIKSDLANEINGRIEKFYGTQFSGKVITGHKDEVRTDDGTRDKFLLELNKDLAKLTPNAAKEMFQRFTLQESTNTTDGSWFWMQGLNDEQNTAMADAHDFIQGKISEITSEQQQKAWADVSKKIIDDMPKWQKDNPNLSTDQYFETVTKKILNNNIASVPIKFLQAQFDENLKKARISETNN